MALSARATLIATNLARRGDSFARQVINKATLRDNILIRSLARRGDLLAQRHIYGSTSSSISARALVSRLARFGDQIAQGLKELTTDLVAQTISGFTPSESATFGDAPVTLSATASSGLAVVFSVVSGPATVAGATLTFTGAGSVVVRASQAGDSNYAAATPVNVTITVAQAAQTISFTAPATATQGDSPLTLTGSATSGLPLTFAVQSGPGTILGDQLTITGTGDIVVRASQAGDTNYAAATPVDQTITITA